MCIHCSSGIINVAVCFCSVAISIFSMSNECCVIQCNMKSFSFQSAQYSICMQGGDKAGKKQGKKAAETAADKDARRRKKEQQREAAAAAEAEVARKRAELELLLMDESAMHQAKPACELALSCPL